MSSLAIHLHTLHCQKDTKPQLLSDEKRKEYLKVLPDWNYSAESKNISRRFKFNDYNQTLAFINAAAWIIQQQDHHPQIEFGYNNCTIYFTTHSAHGITLFDFICAAHIEQLLLT